MERMKAQHRRPPLATASPTPLPLPSPHLIFISGAASTALGREQRNLPPAPLPRLGLGPCAGEGAPGTQRKSLEAPAQGPTRPSSGIGLQGRRAWGARVALGGKARRPPKKEGYSFLSMSLCPFASLFGR